MDLAGHAWRQAKRLAAARSQHVSTLVARGSSSASIKATTAMAAWKTSIQRLRSSCAEAVCGAAVCVHARPTCLCSTAQNCPNGGVPCVPCYKTKASKASKATKPTKASKYKRWRWWNRPNLCKHGHSHLNALLLVPSYAILKIGSLESLSKT